MLSTRYSSRFSIHRQIVKTTPVRSLFFLALGTALACSGEESGGASGGLSSGGLSSGGSTAGGAAGTGNAGGSGGVVIIPTAGASGSAGTAGTGAAGSGPCEGLQCKQASCALGACEVPACAPGVVTTVSGTVFDPSGTLPLYNVMVYVPNAELEPLVEGASCNTCDVTVSGQPVASAITDEAGRFVLEDVPVGENIPLVIQVGKWRRQVTLPAVAGCVENPIVDAGITRLPANQGEGDLPRIAVSTGELDALECLLRKIGISPSEFTNPDGPGRVNLFGGHGGTDRYETGGDFPVSEDALWDSAASLQRYDVVLLSCEGGEHPDEKPTASRQAMFEYANAGGRVFLSHWHKIWLDQGPDLFPEVVTFNETDDDQNITATIDTSFPKGEALANWLVNVQGSTTLGQVELLDAQNTAATENPDYARRWIYDPMDQFTDEISVKYVTANTPVGATTDAQCGRVVYSDIHVSSGDASGPDLAFPTGCTSSGLSPQEKVLIFMLFDLSACLIPDDEVPEPPVVIK